MIREVDLKRYVAELLASRGYVVEKEKIIEEDKDFDRYNRNNLLRCDIFCENAEHELIVECKLVATVRALAQADMYRRIRQESTPRKVVAAVYALGTDASAETYSHLYPEIKIQIIRQPVMVR